MMKIYAKNKLQAAASKSESSAKEDNLDELFMDLTCDDVFVRKRACDSLTASWTSGKVPFDELILQCAARAALNRNTQGLLMLTSKISLMILASNVELDQCGMLTRYLDHPWIRIFMNQPSCSSTMCMELQELFLACSLDVQSDEDSYFKNVLVFLKPVLEYVAVGSQVAPVGRAHIFDAILMTASTLAATHKLVASSLFLYLLDVLPLLKTGADSIASSSVLVQKLTVWYLQYKTLVPVGAGVAILRHLLAQCYYLQDAALSANIHLRLFQEILAISEAEISIFSCQVFLFEVAELILRADQAAWIEQFKIVFRLLPWTLDRSSIYGARLICSYMVLPVLHVAANLEASSKRGQVLSAMVANVITNVDKLLDVGSAAELGQVSHADLDGDHVFTRARSSLVTLDTIMRKPVHVQAWLEDLLAAYSCSTSPPVRENIVLVLGAILVLNTSSVEICRKALQVMVKLAYRDPDVVQVYLPLLLKLLNHQKYQVLKLEFLGVIPKLAVDKSVVSAILKTILLFSGNLSMLGLSIQMMTELWLEQPRVFPYLQQLLNISLPVGSSTEGVYVEWLVSRATAMFKICSKSAAQHGKDVIGLLATMLDDLMVLMPRVSSRDPVLCALAIVIESFKLLCEAEVLDLISFWRAVSSRLNAVGGAVINCCLCSLLAYLPNVLDSTQSKQSFLEESVQFLWSCLADKDVRVVESALKTLSLFPVDAVKVRHLPNKVKQGVVEQLTFLHKNDADIESYDPLQESLPGFAYISLLHVLPLTSSDAFQSYLNRVLENEVVALPRGVGRGKVVRSLGAGYDKLLNEIPAILLSQYETSKRPAVLSGLAGGVLCSYCSEIDGTVVGNVGKRHLKQSADSFQQLLEGMLNDNSVGANDWHQAILLPSAWTRFMTELYNATVQGRAAEVEMLAQKGAFPSDDIRDEDLACVRYWARDHLTSLLKRASRGNPATQGNSVLALAGLLNAVARETASREDGATDVTPEQYLSMKGWMVKVADTIMVVFDGNFKPKSMPFQWCQKVSSDKSTASSLVSRLYASLAMSELVGPITPLDVGRIVSIVDLVRDRCPSQLKAGSSTQMQYFCGLSLGLLVSRLYREQFAEITGQEGYLLVAKAIQVLETVAFSVEDESKDGCVVGYGLAVAALFTDSRKDSRVHAGLAHEKLFALCARAADAQLVSMLWQTYFFSLAAATAMGFATECLNAAQATESVQLLVNNVARCPQASGLNTALGMLTHVLLKSGYSQAAGLASSLLDRWHTLLLSSESSPLAALGAVRGVLSLFGVEKLLFFVEGLSDFDTSLKNKMAVVVKLLISLVNISNDCVLTSSTFHALGQLHMCMLSSSSDKSNAPISYSYLGPKNLLNAIFSSLLDAGKLGPHGEWKNVKVQCLLGALVAVSTKQPLPPVNWALLLSPIMRVGFQSQVRELCFRFAIENCRKTSGMPLWLSSWLQPAVFASLDEVCQLLILRTCAQIAHSLHAQKLQVLIEELLFVGLAHARSPVAFCHSALDGWIGVAELREPVQSAIVFLISAVQKLLAWLVQLDRDDVVDSALLSKLVKCASLLPEGVSTKIFNQVIRGESRDDVDGRISQPRANLRNGIRVELLKLGGASPDDLLQEIEEVCALDAKERMRFYSALQEVLLKIHEEGRTSALLELIIQSVSRMKMLRQQQSVARLALQHQVSLVHLLALACNLLASSGWFVSPCRSCTEASGETLVRLHTASLSENLLSGVPKLQLEKIASGILTCSMSALIAVPESTVRTIELTCLQRYCALSILRNDQKDVQASLWMQALDSWKATALSIF